MRIGRKQAGMGPTIGEWGRCEGGSVKAKYE